MKILMINWQDIKNPLGGGAEVHMHEIFRRIASWGHDVTIFACEYENCKKEEIIDGIKVVRKGSRNFFNFIVKKEYKKTFSKESFDIIIDNINKIPFYTPKYVKEQPLLAISHHFFGKSIYREADFISATYVYIAEKLVDRYYKNTPFAVVSESTKSEFLERGFSEKNFTIVQNAITPEAYPMQLCKKNERPTITYFGRLKKYKSVDHLLIAFAEVKKEIQNAQLYIMGKGDFQPYLEELAKKLNIEKDTSFFGFVSDEDKIKYLSESHIAVNTSMKEGWGITNIEANACSTPVISADSPGLRDSVKKGVSGELYEYANTDELASILTRILKDEERMNEYFEGALEWAGTFSWDDSAKIMIELCEKVIRDFKK